MILYAWTISGFRCWMRNVWHIIFFFFIRLITSTEQFIQSVGEFSAKWIFKICKYSINSTFSYAVSIGLIDVLARRCMKIRESIENHQSVVLSVLSCLCLLTKFADICPKGKYPLVVYATSDWFCYSNIFKDLSLCIPLTVAKRDSYSNKLNDRHKD